MTKAPWVEATEVHSPLRFDRGLAPATHSEGGGFSWRFESRVTFILKGVTVIQDNLNTLAIQKQPVIKVQVQRENTFLFINVNERNGAWCYWYLSTEEMLAIFSPTIAMIDLYQRRKKCERCNHLIARFPTVFLNLVRPDPVITIDYRGSIHFLSFFDFFRERFPLFPLDSNHTNEKGDLCCFKCMFPATILKLVVFFLFFFLSNIKSLFIYIKGHGFT
jgi:hypothetical protein